MDKEIFKKLFTDFLGTLNQRVSDESKNWSIKGFIDKDKNIFTISKDTKVVSKILELHIFPLIRIFAAKNGFDLVLPDFQNYYPDMSFVLKEDPSIKYAVDIKTSYRKDDGESCNGFTLGSHGKYFVERNSTKNIQFPYSSYKAHYCLGIIYSRNEAVDETQQYGIEDLPNISSVIKDIVFFFEEKWKIASDRSGSGNTANIGSITSIADLLSGNGTFSLLGEEVFDDYWMNYGKITVSTGNGRTRTITNLRDFLKYRSGRILG